MTLYGKYSSLPSCIILCCNADQFPPQSYRSLYSTGHILRATDGTTAGKLVGDTDHHSPR